MATTAQDLEHIISTHVENAWPGANSVSGYYDPTGLTIQALSTAPKPTDYLLYAILKSILETRTQDEEFKVDLSSPQRIDLWDDVITRLTLHRDRITALITALTTEKDTF